MMRCVSHRSVRAYAVVALSVLVACSGASAGTMAFSPIGNDVRAPSNETQKSPSVSSPSLDPCQATINEHNGIVSIDLADLTRSGQEITVSVDGFEYSAEFDAAGQMHLEAPLFHSVGDLKWVGLSGASCQRAGIQFTSFSSAYYLALVWSGDYELKLRVKEEDGANVTPEKPNLDLNNGIGKLRRFGAHAKKTRVWLYNVQDGATKVPVGSTWVFVDFASRGNPAHPPFCGDGPLSSAQFSLISHNSGPSTQIQNLRVGSSVCGYSWASDDKSWVRQRF